MPRTPRAPRVLLEITQELIDDAVPRDSSHCLWAESIKAAVPDARNISVDIQTMRYTDPKKGLRYTYLTPRVAQVAIVQFDQGIKPEPHSVQLRAGQVTRSGMRGGKPLSDAQLEQRYDAHAKAAANVGKAKLKKGPGGHDVAVRVGGKTPPIAAGKRRAFGLRGIEY